MPECVERKEYMNRDENNIYITKNLNLGCYLNTHKDDIQLLDVDKTNPKEILFIFSNRQLCEKLVKEYWNSKAQVNAKELLTSLNYLKDRMFN